MEATLIEKLVVGIPLEKKEILDELYNICEREHSSCNSDCPVFKLNGNSIPYSEDESCIGFKSPSKMYNFIQKKSLKLKLDQLLK